MGTGSRGSRWSREARKRARVASSVLMRLAHKVYAALVELVDYLNERSDERGPWALRVRPGCNIATVRKHMLMTRSGKDREDREDRKSREDREFLEQVVDREMRPSDLTRMMRNGEEWASEDYTVIFYRLVCVLSDAMAIGSDAEPGRRADLVGVVKRAVTHASELGFVVMHEGRDYTDVMDEVPIPTGTTFGTAFGTTFGTAFGTALGVGSESSGWNMVKAVEVSEVSGNTGNVKNEKKRRVCLPVFVSDDTRNLVYLGLHVGTLPRTNTPLQVRGVRLTETIVCKHVKLYHPAVWPRSKKVECGQPAWNLEKPSASMLALIETINHEIYVHILKRVCSLAENLKNAVSVAKQWETIEFIKSSERERSDIREKIVEIETKFATEVEEIKKLGHETKSLILASNGISVCSESSHKAVESHDDIVTLGIDVTKLNLDTVKGAMRDLDDLYILCDKLNRGPSPAKKIISNVSYIVRTGLLGGYSDESEDEDEADLILEKVRSHSMSHRTIKYFDASAYKEAIYNLASCLKPKQVDTESKKELALESAEINVPQGADMRVAVQVSGEVFRVLHFTRSEKDERNSQKNEEKAQKEKAQKEEEEDKEATREYKKTSEENATDAQRSKQLDADAEDYKECVRAARKYLEECGIVNDTTESWSSVGWRLTRPERTERTGRPEFGSNARHERPEGPKRPEGRKKKGSEFGGLEGAGKLELVLVPLSAFPNQTDQNGYDGTAEIRTDAVWIIEGEKTNPKKDCPRCAVCNQTNTGALHKTKTAKEGLFVMYNKAQEGVIKGLATRFCFHP